MSRKGNGEGSIYYENKRSGKKRWVAAISDPDCGRVVRRFYSRDEASVWLKATLNETHAFDVCYRENMTTLCYVHEVTFTHFGFKARRQVESVSYPESFQLFDVLFISFFGASYFFFSKISHP